MRLSITRRTASRVGASVWRTCSSLWRRSERRARTLLRRPVLDVVLQVVDVAVERVHEVEERFGHLVDQAVGDHARRLLALGRRPRGSRRRRTAGIPRGVLRTVTTRPCVSTMSISWYQSSCVSWSTMRHAAAHRTRSRCAPRSSAGARRRARPARAADRARGCRSTPGGPLERLPVGVERDRSRRSRPSAADATRPARPDPVASRRWTASTTSAAGRASAGWRRRPASRPSTRPGRGACTACPRRPTLGPGLPACDRAHGHARLPDDVLLRALAARDGDARDRARPLHASRARRGRRTRSPPASRAAAARRRGRRSRPGRCCARGRSPPTPRRRRVTPSATG